MKRILMVSAFAICAAAASATAAPVTTDDLLKAQDNGKEWLTYGRDYRNWRYSPLSEITPDNASRLSPVWAMSTGGQFGGLEATPLFRDGVLRVRPSRGAPNKRGRPRRSAATCFRAFLTCPSSTWRFRA